MGTRFCCPRKDRVTPQELFDKNFPHFVNADGKHIFCRYWEPKTPPRALAMVLHSAGEHSGRYLEIASMLTEHSLFVFSHDLVGHGKSEGNRLNVSSFRVYVRDSLQHFDMIVSRYPNLQVFIFAHSMGGTIAIYVANERQSYIAGVIFVAPLVLLNPESMTPGKMMCAKLMYIIAPNLPLGHMNPHWLSRSEAEVVKFQNDPLNYHGPYRIKFSVQLLEAVIKLEKIFPTITWPMLILHGDMDRLCDIRGSILLYRLAGSSDKTLKIFNKCFHQLHLEVPKVRLEVLEMVAEWIEERMPPAQQ